MRATEGQMKQDDVWRLSEQTLAAGKRKMSQYLEIFQVVFPEKNRTIYKFQAQSVCLSVCIVHHVSSENLNSYGQEFGL